MPSNKPRHPTMSATATLTNCYVPLPLMSPSSSAASFDPQARVSSDVLADGDGNSLTTLSSDANTHKTSSINSSRSSKRGPRTLRQLHLARSILSQSTGSSLVECGHTKLIVSVRGPRPANCGGLNGGNGGGLICEGEFCDWLVSWVFMLALFEVVTCQFLESCNNLTLSYNSKYFIHQFDTCHTLESEWKHSPATPSPTISPNPPPPQPEHAYHVIPSPPPKTPPTSLPEEHSVHPLRFSMSHISVIDCKRHWLQR